MNLLIVSHTPHYLRAGVTVGWGATVREIDELAGLFRSVVHLAPLYSGEPPKSAIPYASDRVRLRAVSPAGGERITDKLGIALKYPGYALAILREIRAADVVHVRAPANLSLLAMVLLALVGRPGRRWAKYAGDWSGGANEPWSYRFQRRWLARRRHRGVVTVNGSWPDQPAWVTTFLNPCLTTPELTEGQAAAAVKGIGKPVRLLFVGRLESAKGTGICLEIVDQLRRAGIAAELDLIGDGDERGQFEATAVALDVTSSVRFHGWLPRHELARFYREAHFILLPSIASEGWPKVLSEAMAYGVVPIATATSSIPQVLDSFSTGTVLGSRDPQLFARAIEGYLNHPESWLDHSHRAVTAAEQFSYSSYLKAVKGLLRL